MNIFFLNSNMMQKKKITQNKKCKTCVWFLEIMKENKIK